jgi:PKD repeat protein
MRVQTKVPYVLVFCLVALVTLLKAQGPVLVKLRNGDVCLSGNPSSLVQGEHIIKDRVFGGRSRILLQFNQIPDVSQKRFYEALGILFLDYYPQNTYLVSVPESLDWTQVEGIRAWMHPDRRFQLSTELFSGNIPDWAIEGNRLKVVIRTYGDVSTEQIWDDLKSRYEVEGHGQGFGRIALRLSRSEIDALIRLPYVQYVECAAPNPTPDDVKGRSLHRSNVLNSDYGAGRHYDGTGVTIGLADDGAIGPHIDYTGRLTSYTTVNNGTHGDMTAGILFGAGNRDPEIRGHATGAYLHYWDIGGYPHIVDALTHFNNFGMVLTSTSYSQGQGGVYSTDAQFIDDQIYNNPQMLHMFSAGNAGTQDHGYGAGAGWGNITGGYKAAKSVITCGNLTPMGILDNSSSRGPADDGRIKPDICANGTDQLSTNSPNTNQVGGGTSAASPSVAGCVTQLYQAYKSLHGGQNPESALIKACILNTGHDLGNPGPDYKHGWGQINALRAVRVLEENRHFRDSVSQGQTRSHILNVPAGTTEIRAMVYWADYPGNPSSTTALVNNLDITLQNGTLYQPWVLDPTANAAVLNANAVRGTDNLNNVEQVTITNPVPGTTTLNVTGTSVPFGPQSYHVVYEFVQDFVELTYPVGGEGLVPGTVETIRWDAYGNTGTFNLDYSTDGGNNWSSLATSVSSSNRSFDWTIPAVVTGSARVRVTSGALADASDANFTIVARPTNLAVSYVCPDSIGLTWTAASGANSYQVFRLGTSFMDSMTVTNGTSATLYGLNPSSTHWFSVASRTSDGGLGKRMVALEYSGGVVNCTVPVDVAVDSVISPTGGSIPLCQGSASAPVTIRVKNQGAAPALNIPVSYRVNGGVPVSEVLSGPIASGGDAVHTFASGINMATAGTYSLEVWATFSGDGNRFNDTNSVSTVVFASTAAALPVSQDFESFTACGTGSNCESDVCNLGSGWINATNSLEDDIDWRVDAGGTPSNGTGPDLDHNPGTAVGKYVYLEASGGCTGKSAYLLSPCIDLTTASNPQVSYWYHLYGVNMGDLHVDVIADGIWYEDVVPVVSGNQGNQWIQASANLTPFVGKTVNIRWRGVTGSDFASDMALDDIVVSEANSAPITSFSASPLTACVGSTVSFADLSINNPTSWTWAIAPNTFTFLGGTNANSQNPQVSFNSPGTYSVSLTSGNSFGSSTFSRTAYITVLSGTTPPVLENFSGVFTPSGWTIQSPGSTTWEQVTGVIGSDGASTDAAKFDNFTYNNVGAEDYLITPPIDLTNSTSATLTFDVAYAEYSAAYADGLKVLVSTDCGITWLPSGYDKSGPTLATTGASTASWTPAQASDWRNESISLGTWIGQTVKIAFVNVNAYGNNIYVDNVNLSSTVGLSSNWEVDWSIYPNPALDFFMVEVNGISPSTLELVLSDLAGRELKREKLECRGYSFKSSFSTTNLASGVYTLSLLSNGSKSTRKLVIR